MSIVKTINLTKSYGQGETTVTALDAVNLEIQSGEFVAVMGPSGCGKSTLLHLVGGLDTPSSGDITLDGETLSALEDEALTAIRRQKIGFIFQFFNLIPVLTARENAALPLILDGIKPKEAAQMAEKWLERVGLADRVEHYPDQLSGGEQQRTAIARALANEPALILADEPTGNLDSRAALDLTGQLRKICDEYTRTILLVTHDPSISAYADRIVFLQDGRIVDETRMAAESQNVVEMEAV